MDAQTGTVHNAVVTSANIHDVTQAHELLHGEERDIFADAGYRGVEKREENQKTQVNWHVAMRTGKRKVLPLSPWGQLLEQAEQNKAKIRMSKVDLSL